MTEEWAVVLPLKPLDRAKSRLAPATGDELRPTLALAFAEDTVSAVLRCPQVTAVAVVTEDEKAAAHLRMLGAWIIPDSPRRGLNAAVEHGARAVRGGRGGPAVAAVNADLPALRPEELTRVLLAAAGYERSFLADAAGTGTTVLAALPGVDLAPGFGTASRTRHRASGAVELLDAEVGPVQSVRQDVDTGEDLRAALGLGVGPRTALGTRGLRAPAPATGEQRWVRTSARSHS